MTMALEQIDVSGYSVHGIRELAKDEDVFCMYNVYTTEKRIFENAGHPERGPKSVDDCWRVKPLRFFVNDRKDDIQVEAFLMRKGLATVFRMKIA